MPARRIYNAYDGFAWFYNRYWAPSFAEDVRPGMQRYFLPLLDPEAKILDICCGSGQTAQWLNACGFGVVGIDGSEDMLALARENAPHSRFTAADARRFALKEKFDAAICLFDSVNHMKTAADLQRFFGCVAAALKTPALFLFDVNTNEGFQESAPEVYTVVEKDHVVVAEATYSAVKGVGRSNVTTFLLRDGSWRRNDTKVIEYCHAPETLAAALRAAGFDEFTTYDGDHDFQMPRGVGRTFYLAVKGSAQSPVAQLASPKRAPAR